jgi:putative DNA primase/helicase
VIGSKAPDSNDILRIFGPEGLRGALDQAKRAPIELKGPTDGSETPVKRSRLISKNAADIKPEKIEWVWNGRLARGKHTCIGGQPGTGKSQLSIAIIAAITTGGPWPCREGRAPLGKVVILSAEDGAADTIVPRLMAAEADLTRVEIISAVADPDNANRTFNLQGDLDLLEQKLVEIGDVALVIIDPISSYMGKADSHKNSEVRGVLEPLSALAERRRVAILSITHFSKGGPNSAKKAIDRFIGSIAFTGAPRAAFAVIEDPETEGRVLFLPVKNNIASRPKGLAYKLVQCVIGEEADGIVASYISWEPDHVSIGVDQALAADSGNPESRTAKAEATEFLQNVLAEGPVAVSEINKIGRDHGFTPKVMRSAREALGVKNHREGFGQGFKSMWSLPDAA